MITLQITEATALRLMALCEKDVRDIGARLSQAGMGGLGKALTDLRAASGLIANLEAAGVKVAAKTEEEPVGDTTPEPAPSADATEAEPSTGEPDDAPPPAVIAARAKANGANGSRQKFVRTSSGAGADTDASSGP